MVRFLTLGLLFAIAACGLELSRIDGSVEVHVLGLPQDTREIDLHIEHQGHTSVLRYEVGAVLLVLSVPSGNSTVWAVARNGVELQSNRVEVKVFDDEVTRIAVRLTQDLTGDPDEDGVTNRNDNCPNTANSEQTDSDRDGLGDPCDVCLANSNPAQNDYDGDGFGDLCDADSDDDGTLDVRDACPLDEQGITDLDADGICDEVPDNCPQAPNPDQADCDEDGQGDACDLDIDDDGVQNATDVCPFAPDPQQTGEACAIDLRACVR